MTKNLRAEKNVIESQFNKLRIKAVEKYLGIEKTRVHFVPHYFCHHYHAYYSGSVRGSDVIVMHSEASGDGVNALISEPSPEGLKIISSTNESDIGRLYKWVTLLLGMKPHQHEFKVMGLAPYANTYETKKAAKFFDSIFTLDEEKMLIKYADRPKDLYFHFREKLKACRFDGIANALQSMVEKQLSNWFQCVLQKTGKKCTFFHQKSSST